MMGVDPEYSEHMIEESVVRERESRVESKKESSTLTDSNIANKSRESIKDDSKILVRLKETLEKEDQEKNRLIVEVKKGIANAKNADKSEMSKLLSSYKTSAKKEPPKEVRKEKEKQLDDIEVTVVD